MTSAFSRRRALQLFCAAGASAALPRWVHAAAAAHEPYGNPNIDDKVAAFEAAPLDVNPLAKSLAVLSGPGGNMAVYSHDGGSLLVDTGVHFRVASVAKAAEKFGGPIKLVANTHFHFDHTGGNEFFGRRGNKIFAHSAVRARLSTPQHIEAFDFTFPAAPPAAIPTETFDDTHDLPGDVHVLHVDPAHTDGDALFHFKAVNALHMGDTFFNGFYPFIDYSSGGWIGGMVSALDRGLTLCDAQTRVIPGHGPIADRDALRAAREMLMAVQAKIEPLLDAGKSVDEIAQATPTRDFDAQWGKGFFNGEAFTRNAAAGLIRRREKKA